MAGASTPASPEEMEPLPAGHDTSGLGPLHCRAAATGEHAEYLAEAAARLESVASVLAAVAMDHTDCDPGDLLPPVIAVLDDAQTFVHRAGEE